MATKSPYALLVDCPPLRHDGGGGGGRQPREWRNILASEKACVVALLVLVAVVVITGLTFLGIFLDRQFPSKDPVFTMAITGVDGLDILSPPWATDDDDDYYYYSPAMLSPMFNLTFQIDNTCNAYDEACVPGLSKADVSYGDAFLAGGSVPPFCAREKRRSDRVAAARVWGENVAVPQFLRDQLAAATGDASVDVKVTMPTFYWKGSCGGTAMLSCKPKIGGASPPCRLDYF